MGVAPLDQRVQRERHPLRVDVVPAQRHREREVQQQRGRGLGALLGLEQLEVVGLEPHPGSRAAPDHGVEHAPLDRDLPRVAEPPRPGRAGRFGEPAGLAGLVHTLAIPPQLLEHAHERPLPHRARALRGDLEPAPFARDQAGALQRALDLLEPPEIAHGVLAERLPQRVLVDVVDRGARVVALQRAVELLELVQAFHRVDRRRQRHRFVAAGERRFPPPQVGERRGQVRAQPVDLEREIHVLQDLLGERPELGALLGRHRGQQPGHRRHPGGHLLEQLVERLRVAGEEVAVALHEPLEVVGLAPLALLDHLVQLGEHVAEPGEVLGRHRSQPLGHAAEVRAHHLLADVLHQLVEGRLRLGIDEPVVAQLADPARDVGRKGVEEGLAHPRVVLGLERERRAFAIDDVVETLAELLERAGEVEVRLLPRAPLAEPRTERVQAARSSPASRGASAARGPPRSPDPTARRPRAPRAARRRTARVRTDPACRPSASSGPAPDQPTPGHAERGPSRCRVRW